VQWLNAEGGYKRADLGEYRLAVYPTLEGWAWKIGSLKTSHTHDEAKSAAIAAAKGME
jgi:hypothetical protein